jgi:Ca2+-transporting ATPase
LPPDSTRLTGLTEEDAAARLRQAGYNELPSAGPRSIFRITLGVLSEPMLLLLLACGAIYFALGDVREASVLMLFVVVVIAITLYQERKTERALDALRDLSSPRALVIRDGQHKRIAGREVVPGDLLVLVEGDRIAADGVLLSATNFAADESLLTGESVPVGKRAGEPGEEMRRPGGDGLSFVYSGTLVVRGNGIAQARATGIGTEIGQIGRSLASVKAETTLLQKEARRIVRIVAGAALFLCGVLLVAFGLRRGDWSHALLAAVALAMAILPEELPVILTVFLALGAWRLSRLRVLTRSLPAIESLGAATVLCVDKTGTLTMNRMTVQRLFAHGESWDVSHPHGPELPRVFRDLVEFSVLASRADTFDPMDIGIRKFGETALAGAQPMNQPMHRNWSLVREYPLSSSLPVISEAWRAPEHQSLVIAAKGAPEAIVNLCHLAPEESARVLAQVSLMANAGLRVLGVARAQIDPAALPESQHDLPLEFAGLLALADPIRPAVPDAVRECQTAGIRVVMITGDFPGTASSIARQIGLDNSAGVMTGAELASLAGDELQQRIRGVNVFARVAPEQKLGLVNVLKADGQIVAMTGDGVNDAPALKSAHIGVAMGERGTDVAREAADLVLLDDDFSSIVHAVRLGRRIYDNLKKAITYAFAIHVPIAGLSLLPILFNWPLILEPIHIAFLELIIDPACSLIFEAEPEEKDIMQRPPRPIGERLFNRRMIALSLLQGTGVLLIVLGIFGLAMYRGQGEADARTLTFTALILANLSLIYTNRSWTRGAGPLLRSRNAAMWRVVGAALIFLAVVLSVPVLRGLFDFTILHPNDVVLCFAAGLVSVAWLEALKAASRQVGSRRIST